MKSTSCPQTCSDASSALVPSKAVPFPASVAPPATSGFQKIGFLIHATQSTTPPSSPSLLPIPSPSKLTLASPLGRKSNPQPRGRVIIRLSYKSNVLHPSSPVIPRHPYETTESFPPLAPLPVSDDILFSAPSPVTPTARHPIYRRNCLPATGCIVSPRLSQLMHLANSAIAAACRKGHFRTSAIVPPRMNTALVSTCLISLLPRPTLAAHFTA